MPATAPAAAAVDATYLFPSTREEFLAGKPNNVSIWGWLIHPLNPYRFETWILLLIKLIKRLCRPKGWTFAKLINLAKMAEISDRWLREILRRLELIGIVNTRVIRKNKQYQIAAGAFLDHNHPSQPPITATHYSHPLQPEEPRSGETSAIFQKNSPVKRMDRMVAGDQAVPTRSETNLSTVDLKSIITTRARVKADDSNIDPIVTIFEQATGARYRPDREDNTLAEMKRFDSLAVEAGILETALRATSQINSLKYCLPQARLFNSMLEAAHIPGKQLMANPTIRPQFISRESLRLGMKRRRIMLARVKGINMRH